MAVRKLYDEYEDDLEPVPAAQVDRTTGVPEAEQKDMRAEIDMVAAVNRFLPDPAEQAFRPKRGGVLFPILVNFVVLLALAGGVYALFFLNPQSEPAESVVFRESAYPPAAPGARAGLIEEELTGFYTAVRAQIREGRIPEAAQTVITMREFLETPSFRLAQNRKAFYQVSLDVVSELVAGSLLNSTATLPTDAGGGALPAPADPVQPEALRQETDDLRREYEAIIADLKTQNETLERNLADRERRILDFAQTASGAAPADYEELVTGLKNQNAALQQQVAALKTQNATYQKTITTLRTQNTSLQQNTSARDSNVTALRAQNANLQQVVNAQENTIREFINQTENFKQNLAAKDGTISDLRAQNVNLQQTGVALRTQNTTLQQTAGELRTQNTALQQTLNDLRNQSVHVQQNIGVRDTTISDLRQQNMTLQQTAATLRTQNASLQQTLTDVRNQLAGLQQNIAVRDGTSADVRSQNASLQQTVAARDRDIADLRAQLARLQESAGDSGSLRTQNSALQQNLQARDNTIGDLRTQNNNLQQAVTTLRNENANLNLMVDQLKQTNEAVRKLLGTQN